MLIFQLSRQCLVAVLLYLSLSVGCRERKLDAPQTQLRVMTWNVEWLFDHDTSDNHSDLAREQSAPSREYWETRCAAVAAGIARHEPQIVALQEIEGEQTLEALAGQLRNQHRLEYRFAFIQGTDSFTEQDVGLLYQDGLVSFRRYEQTKAMFDSRQYYNLSKHIVAEFQWTEVDSPLTLMNVHLRAKAEAEDIRRRQARLARHWLEPALKEGHDVILLGDLNVEQMAGDTSGTMGELQGAADRQHLVDLMTKLESQRATHLIAPRQFDRILVSQSMVIDQEGQRDWVFEKVEILEDTVVRGARDGEAHWSRRLDSDLSELDVSDHFPVMATFTLQ